MLFRRTGFRIGTVDPARRRDGRPPTLIGVRRRILIRANNRFAPHDGRDFLAVQRFKLQESLGQRMMLFFMLAKHIIGAGFLFLADPADFIVDELRRLLGNVLLFGDGMTKEYFYGGKNANLLRQLI